MPETGPNVPTLEDFAAQQPADFYSEAELLALLRVAKEMVTTANTLTVTWEDAGTKKTASLPMRCVVCCGAIYEAYTADISKGT